MRELYVNIRLFRRLIPHLPSNHVEQVKLRGGYITNDEYVNDVNDLLNDVVCDELVISDLYNITTTDIVTMLVNVNVNNVVIECRDVNIDELCNIYPLITFTMK